jgi:methyl acetate hydrolase
LADATLKINQLLRAATDGVAVVVALATTATETVYEGAFGHRGVTSEVPTTVDTIFWLASMTKLVVSVAAMQLVEQGQLRLDSPVADVLPALGSPQVLSGFDHSGRPMLRPAVGHMTLRQLLSHTSGYGYGFWSEALVQHQRYHRIGVVPDNWEELASAPLLSDPGSRWVYGIGHDVAGKMVEAVSGQPLDEYLDSRVFGPLGMVDTGVSLSPAQRSRVATMHSRQTDGCLAPMEFRAGGGRGFCMGGGALCGTGPDYLQLLRMILNEGTVDGRQILSPESVAELDRNQIGDLWVSSLQSALPAFTNDVDLLPGLPKKWGLGFLINTEPAATGRSRGSLAWGGLGNTYCWVDRRAGLAGVILMQILPFADQRALDVFAAFETAVYQAIR